MVTKETKKAFNKLVKEMTDEVVPAPPCKQLRKQYPDELDWDEISEIVNAKRAVAGDKCMVNLRPCEPLKFDKRNPFKKIPAPELKTDFWKCFECRRGDGDIYHKGSIRKWGEFR